MPLLYLIRTLREQTHDPRNAFQANNEKLAWRIGDVFARTWDLGFTTFGGPPVHFQILHQRFVEGRGGKAPSAVADADIRQIFPNPHPPSAVLELGDMYPKKCDAGLGRM
ncbi:hypothetical protein V1520DRAFT_62228 [Lipomyces starkeyi]